jgi:hypothetical protein
MSAEPRPPFLDGGHALIHGAPAALIARRLAADLAAGWLEGVREPRAGQVRAHVEAIRLAGEAWRLRIDPASASGSTEAPAAEAVAPSQHDDIGVPEAAAMLDVSERRVRMLAVELGGRKVGGSWLLARDAVLAEVERRAAA